MLPSASRVAVLHEELCTEKDLSAGVAAVRVWLASGAHHCTAMRTLAVSLLCPRHALAAASLSPLCISVLVWNYLAAILAGPSDRITRAQQVEKSW